MKEFELKYGCNPNQKPAKIFMRDGSDLPVRILNGRPGYINFLDAFNSWQLVKELREATGLPSAASFKHVSPAGAAVGLPLSDVDRQIYFVSDDLDPVLLPVRISEPEVQTGFALMETGRPSVIPVMKRQHCILRMRSRMASLLQLTQMLRLPF